MFNILTFHKIARALQQSGFSRGADAVTALGRIFFSAYVPAGATIGEGTELGYGGIGVIVHREAVVGRNCLLSPGVVLGGRSELPGAPVLEDDVLVGAGAKILGPIRIGAGAKIGANAVVLHDVAPGDTVAGIPARSVRRKKQTSAA